MRERGNGNIQRNWEKYLIYLPNLEKLQKHGLLL